MAERKKLHVKEFQTRVREGMDRISTEHGWSLDKASERGYAFQWWIAEVISGYEDRFETSVDDAFQLSKDLGADLVFEDISGSHLLICQCKYASLSKGKENPTSENEVASFFGRHDRYMDRDWVLQHGSERAASLLADYSERIQSGWSVEYRLERARGGGVTGLR